MEKRDLILDQIEQLGYFLRKMFAAFLDKNSAGNTTEALDLVTNEFKSDLDFDLPLFVDLSNEEMKIYVLNFKFNEQNLENLSELLKEMSSSKSFVKETSNQYLKKALELLDFADETSNSFSFERNNRKNQIKISLNSTTD
jgi:hypothetical protein